MATRGLSAAGAMGQAAGTAQADAAAADGAGEDDLWSNVSDDELLPPERPQLPVLWQMLHDAATVNGKEDGGPTEKTMNIIAMRVMDLQRQQETLREEIAELRGEHEHLNRTLTRESVCVQGSAGALYRRAVVLQSQNHALGLEVDKLRAEGGGAEASSSSRNAGGPEAEERRRPPRSPQTSAEASRPGSAEAAAEEQEHFSCSQNPAQRQVRLSMKAPEVVEVEAESSINSASRGSTASLAFSICTDDSGQEGPRERRGETEISMCSDASLDEVAAGQASRRSSLRSTYGNHSDWLSFVAQPAENAAADEDEEATSSSATCSRSSAASSRPRGAGGRGRRPSGARPPVDAIHGYMEGMSESNQRRVLEHMVRNEQEISYLRSVIHAYEDMSVTGDVEQ